MCDLFLAAGLECDMLAVQRHFAWTPQTQSCLSVRFDRHEDTGQVPGFPMEDTVA